MENCCFGSFELNAKENWWPIDKVTYHTLWLNSDKLYVIKGFTFSYRFGAHTWPLILSTGNDHAMHTYKYVFVFFCCRIFFNHSSDKSSNTNSFDYFSQFKKYFCTSHIFGKMCILLYIWLIFSCFADYTEAQRVSISLRYSTWYLGVKCHHQLHK